MGTLKHHDLSSIGILEYIPLVSYYATTRGWRFVLSWTHRIFGLVLVGYLLFHISTLSFLSDPASFDAIMTDYDTPFFKFLEWILAFPLLFHGLNGARLILYESFGERNDRKMVGWLFLLLSVYMAVLAFFMLTGDHTVSTLFFWLNILILGMLCSFYLCGRIWKTANSSLWKLQRLSASFLLILLPAHMIFMHMNPSAGHEASSIIARMHLRFMTLTDLTLLLFVLYHAAFGTYTVIGDYVGSKALRRTLAMLVVLTTVYFCYIGVRLSLSM